MPLLLQERLAVLRKEQAEADTKRDTAWQQLKAVVQDISKLASPGDNWQFKQVCMRRHAMLYTIGCKLPGSLGPERARQTHQTLTAILLMPHA